MTIKTISSTNLQSNDLPASDADVHELIKFAHTFDGYARWGSSAKCAEIANAPDHSTIDALRTCLFFEARRWRHFGETPDDDALQYWKSLVVSIRERILQLDSYTPEWLSDAIKQLPSDVPVSLKTQGYNQYTTQKDHWLGWLNPAAGTGSYPRRTGGHVSAKTVYNRIGEPKMLWWLASAAEVDQGLLDEAKTKVDTQKPLSSQCADFRKVVHWRTLVESLEQAIRNRASGVEAQGAVRI